jgi:pilus assembly protein Flp/PilA
MLNSFTQYFAALMLRLQREEGQTMAEYGMLLAVIAVVVVVVAMTLGTSISSLFSKVAGGL